MSSTIKIITCLVFTSMSFLLVLICNAQSTDPGSKQDSITPNFVKVAAGPQFKATSWKQFWWGKHWRKEWLVPVSFPIFNIDTTVGGLTPQKMGGGHQTKSLRMLNKEGREYILRTIDKDLELLIPEEFKGTFINDIVNDQISTAHPYGPLAIASLTERIGSLHTNPVIVYVTDNPSLGEFRTVFANKLCLFEERPSGDGWEKTALTKNADDVVNTEKLYEKLLTDHDKQVDQHQYLRIRLLDMLVNDWDRHPDQWVWAGYKSNGKTIYYPFARDRDQAFSKTDGVSIYFLSMPWLLRSVRNFKPDIDDIVGVNLAAVSLDQQFLNKLTKEEWLAEIRSIQDALTDSAIHNAVMQMPKEVVDMSGAFVEKRLKQRRNNMQEYGMEYYRKLNKKVFILGSYKKELFTINKISRGKTEIMIRKIDKDMLPADTLFHRTFTGDITNEINLYGFGNTDQFVYTGNAKNRIFTRSFGGDGNDEFSDSTGSKGTGKRSRIYDTKEDTVLLKNTYKVKNTNDTTYTTFKYRAFKYDWWKPVFTPGYNPDDGILVGAGITYRKQGWHKTPYEWEQRFTVNVATATGAVGVSYVGIFKEAIGKWDFDLNAEYRAPKYVLNFYGYGNETKLPDKDKDFFRVRSKGFWVNPGVSRLMKSHLLKAGLIFLSAEVLPTADKFISQGAAVDSSVFTEKYFAGANISYSKIILKNMHNPQSGLAYKAEARYLFNLDEPERDFVKLQASVKFYFPLVKGLIFAHRTGAATNIGDYEFYQANSIGGLDYLRGYWRSRFTGETSFYQNTELRLLIAKLRGYVFRGSLGMYGFFDDGRVWIKDENSNKIHVGYGGGIYYVPYNKIAVNIEYGCSSEANVFAIRAGFFF